MRQINLIMLGILVVFIGIILIFLGTFTQLLKQPEKTDTKVAVGGFVGPFIFGFGNDKQLSRILIFVSIAFFLLWVFLQWYLRK